jgi:hypothetical protein
MRKNAIVLPKIRVIDFLGTNKITAKPPEWIQRSNRKAISLSK